MNKKLNEKLDKYLANLAVGNILMHNLHWNVYGFSFVSVHQYLESVYNSIFEKYDGVAEIQKMQGEYPKASMKKYLELTSIDEIEESKDVDQKEALKVTLKYFKDQKDLAYEIRNAASVEDNFPITNMMEEHIADYNKQIWFIESTLK